VVFTDHAGFDTRATMERAHAIFGVDEALIVTQGFHMKRALFLADAAGIDAEGVTSDLHDYGAQGVKSDLREIASRLKAAGEVLLGRDVTGGPGIPIDGPATASWGPPPPADTPPAGAPGR
jgi:vancomycin permeability regulator SanA